MSRAQDADYQPKAKVIEQPELNPEGFDLRVQIKDANTGKVIRHQPYTCHIVGGSKLFERPKGSGNLYYESGLSAGRLGRDGQGNKYADTTKAHIEIAEAKEVTLEAIASENESLKAELAALKAEQTAATAKKEVSPKK